MGSMKSNNYERKFPDELLVGWTDEAIKSGQRGMLIVTDGDKVFAHYEVPTWGLWDTAIALEKTGYEVLEFHIFK